MRDHIPRGSSLLVKESAITAAAMRLAVAETIAVQDNRDAIEKYLERHPEVRLVRGGEE